MSAFSLTVDQFLRREGPFAAGQPRALFGDQLRLVLAGGVFYGVVMGSYNGVLGDGWKQMLLSGVKVPCLFFVTFLLCLPSFFVINTVAGLRGDFAQVLRALLAFQSLVAVMLAAFAP